MGKIILGLTLLGSWGLAHADFNCNQYTNPNLVNECLRIQKSVEQNQKKSSNNTEKQFLSPVPGATQPKPSFETNSPVVPTTPPPSQQKPVPDTHRRIRLFY